LNIKRPRRSRFYFFMTVTFMVIALVGFSTTFLIPIYKRSFEAPLVIHVHASLVFGWLIFLILQSGHIQTRKHQAHRRLGWLGLVLALAIVPSGIAVGLYATRRDLGGGDDPFVLGQYVNVWIEMLLFGGLVVAAILSRRKPDVHKRLILLATISALAPAWLRLRHLFPAVPHPFVTFALLADSLLVVAIVHDLLTLKRVHPTYVWAGSFMVAVHILEIVALTSEPWLGMSRFLLRLSARMIGVETGAVA
jgi:hypothetical protein